jgi:BolA protein
MSMHKMTKQIIEERLRRFFEPVALEVIDDSDAHSGHNHAMLKPAAGHFKVIMTSACFDNKNQVARHRMVYEKLADLMDTKIHALSLNLFATND